MIISVVVGVGKNREIGKDNQLLWKISEDLKNFKKITMGHHMLMGRKTFESIGRPLPGRTTLVLSRNPDLKIEGVTVVNSFDQAMDIAARTGESELMIVGGEKIYELALPKAHKLYISHIDYVGEADAYFPEYSQYNWRKIAEKRYNAQETAPSWRFEVLEKTPE